MKARTPQQIYDDLTWIGKIRVHLAGTHERIYSQALEEQNDELTYEIERMRPVVNAAVNWAKDDVGGGAEIDGEYVSVESLCEDLAEAVDRYLQVPDR